MTTPNNHNEARIPFPDYPGPVFVGAPRFYQWVAELRRWAEQPRIREVRAAEGSPITVDQPVPNTFIVGVDPETPTGGTG